jgi:hypothetical protein
MNGNSLCETVDVAGTRGPTFRDAAANWSLIGTRTVYFAHQSVGSGVVAGVKSLAKEHGLSLRVVETREPASISGPAFVHFLVGEKRNYASKNAALLRLLEAPGRGPRPVVVMKYCYADANPPVNVARMFEAYQDTVDTIRYQHPDVRLVHTTIPLVSVEGRLKSAVRTILGKEARRDAAIARHRYNELLRAEFGNTDPIFDLARLEASVAGGGVAGFVAGGSRIDALATSNTDDGTHLDARCQRLAGEALLNLLSRVIQADQ